jgi:hypothetical protein
MRKILLAIFLLGFATSVHAQFGIRAGLNSANFSNADFSSITGFHIGGYYLVKTATDLVSVEPGIQYSGKGYSAMAKGGSNVTEKLGYVDIPVLVRLSLLPSLNVFAGPQASVLVSRNYTLGNITSTSLEPVRGYELGAVVGLGLKVAAGLNLQASYDLGLSSLNYFNTDVSNRVLKLSVGYTLGN